MDPVFLERHWDSLPNLDRLRRRGDFRRLGTSIPPQSPVAWSTFITGMDPGGHGIYDFVHRNPQTLMPFSSMAETSEATRTISVGPYVLPLSRGKVRSLRHGTAFWQVLADHGIPATILRMPTNFPPIECEGEYLAGMGVPDMRGTFGTFSFYTDDPAAVPKQVPGGQIIPVQLTGSRVTLQVEGPSNTLRKDRSRSTLPLIVDVDPLEPAARFEAPGSSFILKEGEWSGWIRVHFPLLGPWKSASGMFRVYAKKLRPDFQIYVSPINIDPAEPELPISSPGSYSRELAGALGPFYTQGMAEDTAALRQGVFSVEEYVAQSRIVSNEHLGILKYALQHFTEGILFFHFFGVDQDSHMLWGKYEPQLLDTYRLADNAVGWAMQLAPDANLIVMSDHGFTTFARSVHLNTWLYNEGYLALDDPANLGDEELFTHVNWSRTQAYALGLNGVYLNLKGRERNGIVEPGERRELLRQISERLTSFRDPENGKPVVKEVYVTRDVFRGDTLDSAPDLIVGYSSPYRASWQTALGAVPRNVIEDNIEQWRGDHCIAASEVPGVLLGSRKPRVADPQLTDVTTTILAYFGVNRPPAMTGRDLY
jgi:predicted AlkP superfamily phosphohydrolase/phosphomutase